MPLAGRMSLRTQLTSQGGYTIPEILDSNEMAFMSSVWPQVRVAARFSDINWAAHGSPDGPPLDPPSYAAMAYVWPQIRVAASFSDPSWDNHRVPVDILAAAMPIPEAPPNTPPPVTPAVPVPAAPAPAVPAPWVPPSIPVPGISTPYYPPTILPAPSPSPVSTGPLSPYYEPPSVPSYRPIPDAIDESGTVAPQQAGFFGQLSLPMIASVAGAILFFSLARGARTVRGKRRRPVRGRS